MSDSEKSILSNDNLAAVSGGQKCGSHYYIDTKECCLCGACKRVCKSNAISHTDDGKYVINSKKCVGCEDCMNVCPTQAINHC